jgi:hypothetical protein
MGCFQVKRVWTYDGQNLVFFSSLYACLHLCVCTCECVCEDGWLRLSMQSDRRVVGLTERLLKTSGYIVNIDMYIAECYLP